MAIDAAGIAILNARLTIAIDTVKALLQKIKKIDADAQVPAIQKLSEIKKIKEELSKVGMEIDNVKREIILLKTYRIN